METRDFTQKTAGEHRSKSIPRYTDSVLRSAGQRSVLLRWKGGRTPRTTSWLKSCWIGQSSSSLRMTGLLIWICVVWRANRDAKLELVTLDDARTAWCLYTPMVFMLLTWNSNLTHICQAKFARIEGQHGLGQGGQIRHCYHGYGGGCMCVWGGGVGVWVWCVCVCMKL